ncbi:hypothetical protein [Polaribacter cellanae]|uniref:Uncharacterized protein n=1 Tax=Polaribacter cellanae TaxID=2818493 RepID=A0A975CQX9_9FLAO|nr:hypothetical protein [Polaribacter cellanae]QTE23229.1 hypothetical protein J3359_02825 [Polaribacter cellanae]
MIEKVANLIKEEKKEFWNELSLAQKEEIEKADLEILNEETTDYETFISSHRNSKLEFIKEFINLKDKETINKLENILWQKNDFWHKLSPTQKDEINLGIKQLNEGKRYSYEAVLKEIS